MSKNNVWIDESPLASVITVSSGLPTQGSVSPNSPAAGVPYNPLVHGGSTLFNGTSVLQLAYDSGIDFGTGDFTVEFWVNPRTTASSGDFPVFGSFNLSSTTLLTYIGGSSDINEVRFGSSDYFVGCGRAQINEWHHFAISRNSGVIRTYRDGIFITSRSDSRQVNVGTGGLFLGKAHSGDTVKWFSGLLGPIRFVKGTGLYPGGTSFTPQFVLQAVSGTVFLLNHYNVGIFDSSCKVNLFLNGAAGTSRNTTTFKYGDGSFKSAAEGLWGEAPGAYGNLKTALGSGDWTIEMWMHNSMSNGSSTRHPLFITGNNTYTGNGSYPWGTSSISWSSSYVGIRLVGSRRISIDINGTDIITSSIQYASDSNWTHIAATRQGTTYRLFLNGNLAGTATNSGLNLTNTFFCISGGTGDYSNPQAFLDDLRVTRGVARYIADFIPPTTGLPKA